MMEVVLTIGDLLDETADAVISTANPWLNMSGGVNGEILRRGGEGVQQELRAHLRNAGRAAVEPGTVVVTGPGPVRAKYLLHAVAIDPFYDSSPELVRRTVDNALRIAAGLGATTVAMPALATGYGRLSMEQFAAGLADALKTDWPPIGRLTVVVRKAEYVETVRQLIGITST